MMLRKMTGVLVFFLALLLTTVPAWSSMPGHFNPADSGTSFTTDLDTLADYTFKTEIILAQGGHDEGGQDDNGEGDQGSNGNSNGDDNDRECDGPEGPAREDGRSRNGYGDSSPDGGRTGPGDGDCR